jgi:hypothetical protein
MTMEKRGVIDDNTPSGTCCGGKEACGDAGDKGEAGEMIVDEFLNKGDRQMLLKFGQCAEPTTEEEADDMESSPMTDAIDIVTEETDKNVD